MTFLLLAILILILSFVVALWSLVSEEKKISSDEGIREREIESRGLVNEAAAPLPEDAGQEKLDKVVGTVDGPQTTTKSDFIPQQLSSAPTLSTGVSGGRVWWEELEGKQAESDVVVSEDEQRSIEEIRAQLSQIVAARGHTTTDDTEPVEVFEENKKSSRDQKVFLGEISLSNLRRGN